MGVTGRVGVPGRSEVVGRHAAPPWSGSKVRTKPMLRFHSSARDKYANLVTATDRRNKGSSGMDRE